MKITGNRISILFLIVLTLLLSACSTAGMAPAMERSMDYEEAMAYPQEAPAAYNEAGASYDDASGGYNGSASVVERMVIRNANLSLVVADPEKSVEEISSIATQMGGYVISSSVYQTTYGQQNIPVTRGSISIRVLSDSLDNALAEIKDLAIEVDSESVTGEDVTDQYTDLQSQLRNSQAAEEQLLKIMDSATETEDVLQIFNQLKMVREEIEVLTGRMEYLEDSARLSQIQIDLIPDEMSQPLQIGGWEPKGTARDAVEALVGALQFIAEAGIWFVICVVPVGLILGVPLYFAFRAINRKRLAKKAEREAKKAEAPQA
ncbi:MAG: DUF4349 domain-containing protein [Anaerolineales bacterium]|nr:DUF4349 domain-containing protein [Anaerolineales bacterium]